MSEIGDTKVSFDSCGISISSEIALPTRFSKRFLRAILSVNDEFYHRHIIQHNLFSPVFEAFRANPVGDNLVSSAIVEMCDFIYTENVKSLIEHIVTKHLSATSSEIPLPSLEDVSSPYVSTLTVLREAYEKNLKGSNKLPTPDSNQQTSTEGEESHSKYFHGDSVARGHRAVTNEKALEDQVSSTIYYPTRDLLFWFSQRSFRSISAEVPGSRPGRIIL